MATIKAEGSYETLLFSNKAQMLVPTPKGKEEIIKYTKKG